MNKKGPGHSVIDRATSLGTSDKNSYRTRMCVMIIAITDDNPATHLPSLSFRHNGIMSTRRRLHGLKRLLRQEALFKGAGQNHHTAFDSKIKGLLDDGFLTAPVADRTRQPLKGALAEPVFEICREGFQCRCYVTSRYLLGTDFKQ